MKKILLSLIMLCCMTAAWAGDGNGSKDNPYSGEWDLKDLTQIIRIGDYLAYDCVLSGGLTVVTDSKLNKEIFNSSSAFAFKDPIGDAPKDEYAVYCENNKPVERQQQAFFVKDIVVYLGSNPTLKITGHYTGKYEKDDAKNIVEVATAEDFFRAFKDNYDKHDVVIKITKDIDMANVASDWSDYINRKDLEFKATIDGYYTAEDSLGRESIAQHSIKNFNSMLVSTMTNATVKGIKLHNWKKHPNVAEDWHPAMLAGRATNCTFQDITLEECSYNDQWLSDLASYVRSGFGLMVNNMDGCTVDGVRIVGCSVQKIGAGVGAIAGIAENSIFRDCYTDHYTSLFAEASNAYVGGFVGKAEKCIFEDCVNMASVMGSEKADNVGGFTGTCTRCRFVNCINTGPLSQISRETFENYNAIKTDSFFSLMNTVKNKLISLSEYDAVWKHLQMKVDNVAPLKVRGMPQHIQSQINLREFRSKMISGCIMNVVMLLWTIKGEVNKALCPDEMGGISGAAYGSKFDRCFNGGLLHCLDAWCGGIVGRARSIEQNGNNEMVGVNEFRNCINRGYVQGDERVGGIVGELEDGHIYNCLNMGSVDCYEETRGSMYGMTGSSKPVINCFALSHEESDYKFGGENDPNKIHNVSLLDIKSGRVAYELNRLSDSNYFGQSIGTDPCPIFNGEIVTPASIRDDVNIIYEVDSLADFLYAMFDQYAEIKLNNDIDFANSWVTLYRQTFPFRGKIDGAFHSIKNLKVKIDGSEDDNNIYHWYENLYRGTRDYYALIGAAEGATFKNLKIEDFDMALPERDAILVGLSKNNTYQNVRLAGKSSIVAPVWAGGLVYESRKDRFVDCTIGKDCKIGSSNITILDYDGDAAGMASQAYGSTFIHCVNNGEIYSRTDGAGGIVCDAFDGCVFERCVNNGKVHHSSKILHTDDEVGGIAATATDCTFIQCVNNGHLVCNDEYGGGIVGEGINVKIDNCLNASQNLEFSENTCGGIIGTAVNSKVTNCFSYADYALIGKNDGMDEASGNNYQLTVKTVCNSPYVMGVTPKMAAAGYVTYWLNNNSAENLKTQPWTQNINQRDYLQVDPHPVLDMHEPVNIEDITGFTYISSADDLKNFAKRVNEGKDDAQFACAVLISDIDLKGEEWTPIGNDKHRFRGLFDGQGHTISGLNCSVDDVQEGAGLFGVVDALTSIENVIVGERSIVKHSKNSGAGSAGIVGMVKSDDKLWGDVHIRNCGNYATVSAWTDAGGILGTVMNNMDHSTIMESKVKVYVERCFNMGTIDGQDSGLLCGYMQNRGVVSDCWSGGKLLCTKVLTVPYRGAKEELGKQKFFVGYDESLDIKNCYAINPTDSVQREKMDKRQNGVTNVSEDDATQGNLIFQLNGNTNDATKQLVWEQNLGADAHPLFGNKGIYHSRDINNEYGTVCLPYTLYSNDNIKYYKFSNVVNDEDEITLQFQYTDKVKPGTPTIFRSKTMGVCTFIDELDKYEGTYDKYDFNLSIEVRGNDWKMHSHPFEKVFEGEEAKTVYYVYNNEIRNAKKTTVAPYRAYFRGPDIMELTGNQAQTRVRIVIEDEDGTTSIIAPSEWNSLPLREGWGGSSYSLMGTEVNDSYRGIVIKNGKKYLRK
ncbi:MAG: hypothetical protein KBT33_03755 [Prevotellaceae bacterium]|nr:hypothetical protein [Candidatus Minthosoma equi]